MIILAPWHAVWIHGVIRGGHAILAAAAHVHFTALLRSTLYGGNLFLRQSQVQERLGLFLGERSAVSDDGQGLFHDLPAKAAHGVPTPLGHQMCIRDSL